MEGNISLNLSSFFKPNWNFEEKELQNEWWIILCSEIQTKYCDFMIC